MSVFKPNRTIQPEPIIDTDVVIAQRDDGQFQIGISDDAPGPFPSRRFACAVAQRAEARPP